jgi:hypothetical protein
VVQSQGHDFEWRGREDWAKEEEAKEDKEMKEFEALQDAACDVYDMFHDVAGRRLKNLRNDDLKTLIKFIVPLEGRDGKKCPSSRMRLQ